MVILKLDGTEDDDDDDDDKTTQNKLRILGCAKDVKTGTYGATCLREKGVSEYANVMFGVPVASTSVSQSDIAK